jgi:hypothetical protein
MPTNYWYMTPGTWFSLIVLVIALFCSTVLPASWRKKNSPLEWLQVVILGFAVLVALQT